MRTYLDCIPCFVRQALDSVRALTPDESVQERVLREVLRAAAEMDLAQPPPVMGKRIHHVLDARTGRNAENGVIQVSVFADDCTTADGLATALMIVGPDQAAEILERPELDGIEVLFLLRGEDGEVETRRLP